MTSSGLENVQKFQDLFAEENSGQLVFQNCFSPKINYQTKNQKELNSLNDFYLKHGYLI